jgi:hypothetical protein
MTGGGRELCCFFNVAGVKRLAAIPPGVSRKAAKYAKVMLLSRGSRSRDKGDR